MPSSNVLVMSQKVNIDIGTFLQRGTNSRYTDYYVTYSRWLYYGMQKFRQSSDHRLLNPKTQPLRIRKRLKNALIATLPIRLLTLVGGRGCRRWGGGRAPTAREVRIDHRRTGDTDWPWGGPR